MSKKCHRCQKTVFHAEEHLYDGMLFHMRCFSLWQKEENQREYNRNNAHNAKAADVRPAYYRTADVTTGEGARMENAERDRLAAEAERSSLGLAPIEPKVRPGVAAGGAGPKFCPECGHSSGGAKFCPECGNKF